VFLKDDQWIYSPSDLTTYMDSPFASWMTRYAILHPATGQFQDLNDTLAQTLQQKGFAHEAEVLQSIIQGKTVINIADTPWQGGDKFSAHHAATVQAMHDGVQVIYQGALACGVFQGYSDFLLKVEGASRLGDYHYEVWDSKLALSVKPYFVVQLCCYAEMLWHIQGCLPDKIHVVLGSHTRESLRTTDYFYYYLALKERFLHSQAVFNPAQQPDPYDSRAYGNWSGYAEQWLQDHLCLIANITRIQVKKLGNAGIRTCAELMVHQGSVSKLNSAVLQKLQKQAQLQHDSLGLAQPVFELITPEPGAVSALALLAPASPHDVYFDIEGFPLIEGGLEYLWGNTYFDDQGCRQFKDFWAHDQQQERIAFRDFIQWVYARWKSDPSMHIYHYANYEIAACRRLMGRYGVCEFEVDQLLRHGVFVDLYNIVRAGLMIGATSYSIKKVEHLYRPARSTVVGDGGDSIVVYEQWRERWLAREAAADWTRDATLSSIRDYNKDDCDSTQELVAWLRGQMAAAGIEYCAPVQVDESEAVEEVTGLSRLRDQLFERADATEATDCEKAGLVRLFGQCLEFHRREQKPMWWRMFDRMGATIDELEDDADCLAYCQRTTLAPFKSTPKARNLSYQYQFPRDQEWKQSAKSYYVLGEYDANGKLLKVDLDLEYSDIEAGLIVVRAKTEPPAVINLIPDEYVNANPIPAAIQAAAQKLLDEGARKQAIYDFLLRAAPRITSCSAGAKIVSETEPNARLQQVIDAVQNLDHSYLTIQGPPGTGKTYTAKHIIAHLLQGHKRIGISSNSHKAINNLLFGVAAYCQAQGIAADFICTSNTDEDRVEALGITVLNNNAIINHLSDRACVVGTTAWGFSRDDLVDQFDYLFIDEAGQVAVANLMAMSRSATNLVIMGDQMQLCQPSEGTHPGQSGLSVLDYLLGDTPAIPPHMGVFLDTTYRMHSAVNRFISAAIYDGQLLSHHSNDRQSLFVRPTAGSSYPALSGNLQGVVFVPVLHAGNTAASEEEVADIVRLVQLLLGSEYTDKDGGCRQVTLHDMLFVSPYNYQVSLLRRALGPQAKVGSVDKFQGQEAPIVFFSMCSSNADESPHGFEFLYNKNRINVAISRAQVLAIVVGNPALFCPAVNTIERMKQANLVSRLQEFVMR
jgi:predicted RecB family nuclease